MGSLSPSPNLMCLVVIRMTCFYKLLFKGRLMDRFFLSMFFLSKLRPGLSRAPVSKQERDCLSDYRDEIPHIGGGIS